MQPQNPLPPPLALLPVPCWSEALFTHSWHSSRASSTALPLQTVTTSLSVWQLLYQSWKPRPKTWGDPCGRKPHNVLPSLLRFGVSLAPFHGKLEIRVKILFMPVYTHAASFTVIMITAIFLKLCSLHFSSKDDQVFTRWRLSKLYLPNMIVISSNLNHKWMISHYKQIQYATLYSVYKYVYMGFPFFLQI